MKLHRIAVENLASLYGRHEVDLDEGLQQAPVFLIMGPTGSGKSTLMDAVSLALFAQTARLSSARGQPDTDSRLVMSWGAGHCRAEVVFSKKVGKTRRFYRAAWSCNRARRKPEGRLQDPERSLEEIDQQGERLNLLISDKRVGITRTVFDEVLEGMTIEDFQRSVLLPQGEFAAFIRADENDRASILERLTSSEVYQQIGRRAAEQWRQVHAQWRELEMAHVAAGGLEEDTRIELSHRAEELMAEEAGAATALDELRHQHGWVSQWNKRRDRLAARLADVEAATAALAECAPSQAALDRHHQGQQAVPLIAEVNRLETALGKVTVKLPGLRDEELELRDQIAAGAETLEERERELTELTDEIKRRGPAIEKARGARAQLDAAREELQLAEEKRDDLASQVDEQASVLRSRDKLAEVLAAELEELEELAQRDLSALPVVRERFADLKRAKVGLADLQGRTAEIRDAMEASRQKREQLNADGVASELAAVDGKIKTLRAWLSSLVPDDVAAAAHRERLVEAVSTREAQLDDLRTAERLAREAEACRAEIAELESALAEILEQNEAREKELQQIEIRIDAQQQLVEEIRQQLASLRLTLSYGEARGKLESGKRCPLCGSTEHPYVESGALSTRDAEMADRAESMAANLDDAKAVHLSLTETRGEIAAADARDEERHESRTALLERAQDRLSSVQEQLKALGHVSNQSAQALESELLVQREQLESLSEALDNVAALQQEREPLAERLAAIEIQRARLDATIESQQTRLSEDTASLDAVRTETKTLEKQLRAHLSPMTGREGPLDELLGEAEKLAEQQAAQRVELDEKRETLRQATSDVEIQTAALTRTTQALEEVEAELERRKARVTELSADESGVDPVAEWELLQEKHEELQQSRRATESALDANRRALASLVEKISEHQERANELTAELSQHNARLDELAGRLGFDGSEQLADAVVSEDEYARLRDEVAERRDALARAEARARAAEEDLAELEETRPDDAEMAIEEITHKLRELDTNRGDIQRELGRVRQRLDDDRRLREMSSEREAATAALRPRYMLFKELHDLIGVGQGERFRRFAQCLNLGDLVEKANERLRWLAPRYRLTTARDDDGLPTLSFGVRDAHQALMERPLTTLSGGETFLVSLAFALALADYRSMSMPIETLLLDEGFGTLDADTLDVAMTALARMSDRGTQIGIISHVEDLHDRIGARVVVEKRGNGRSSLRIELG